MKTVDFSELIEACDLKMVETDHKLTSRRYVSIAGQGHYLTLAQGRVHTKIQTRFPQKLLGHSEINFV